MRQIRSQNTGPECEVRTMLQMMGFEFTQNVKTLAGNPDIVIPKQRTALFINGCYWHRHTECSKGQSIPSTNTERWLDKFEKNRLRDERVIRQLRAAGWKVIVVWECETKPKNRDALKKRLANELAAET